MAKDYVTVYTAYGKPQAEMLCLLLENYGIRAFVAQEGAGVAQGLTIGSLGEADIMVLPEDAEAAIKILSEIESGENALPDQEPDYNETEDEGETNQEKLG